MTRIGAACLLPAMLATSVRAADTPVAVHYVGYVLGMKVCTLDLAATISTDFYQLSLSFRLTGAPGFFYHAAGQTAVTGHFLSMQPIPQDMASNGSYGGVPHATRIVWQESTPHVTAMTPPLEKNRDIVPPSQQAHTVDTLSAMAALMHQVAATGKCAGVAHLYDGVRLSELAAQDGGPETLAPTDRSSFHGPAWRCDLTTRMTGGFLRDDDDATARKPHKATIWLARLAPEQPIVPVRIAFTPQGAPGATIYVK
jgi:hypothetical protein